MESRWVSALPGADLPELLLSTSKHRLKKTGKSCECLGTPEGHRAFSRVPRQFPGRAGRADPPQDGRGRAVDCHFQQILASKLVCRS